MQNDWFDRALQKTVKNPETGCWEYSGEIVHNGYGRIKVGDRHFRIHRLSYRRSHGEIPEGILVCHKCDVRNCWNPEHLFLGTPKDNTEDMVRKGRYVAPPPHRPTSLKLDDAKVREMRRLAKDDRYSLSRLSSIFLVSTNVVSRVLRRKLWAHVP
jgi:hypothetical protein